VNLNLASRYVFGPGQFRKQERKNNKINMKINLIT
jgi:hypothetical protein